jgi:hypothetical protein
MFTEAEIAAAAFSRNWKNAELIKAGRPPLDIPGANRRWGSVPYLFRYSQMDSHKCLCLAAHTTARRHESPDSRSRRRGSRKERDKSRSVERSSRRREKHDRRHSRKSGDGSASRSSAGKHRKRRKRLAISLELHQIR